MPDMKLSEWLAHEKVTHAAFALRVGVHPMSVSKYAAGTMIPRAETMQRIMSETAGAVQPNDFFAERQP